MDSKALPENYLLAEGPDGLKAVLDDLAAKSKESSEILYKIRNQVSRIKVDFSDTLPKIWYYDLNGRPATQSVKATIARFLWEYANAKDQNLSAGSVSEERLQSLLDQQFQDIGKQLQFEINNEFLKGYADRTSNDLSSKETGLKRFENATAKPSNAVATPSNVGMFGTNKPNKPKLKSNRARQRPTTDNNKKPTSNKNR